MKRITILAALAILTGCATPDPSAEDASESEQAAATRAFLAQNNLEPVGWINLRGTLQILGSNEWFAQIQTEDGRFLIETDRPCHSLTEPGNDEGVELFVRRGSRGGVIRRIVPGVDYIRNCRIAAIYDLNNLSTTTEAPAPESPDTSERP